MATVKRLPQCAIDTFFSLGINFGFKLQLCAFGTPERREREREREGER
jgi:hypothetical protein